LLVDVREKPYSRKVEFNRRALSGALAAAGMEYAWMGDRLGGFTCSREDWLAGCAVDGTKDAEMSRSTLTPEKATMLESWWELSGQENLTDEDICGRAGIKFGQLRGWLQRNTKVERENGKKEGLRDIRTRAKAKGKSTYVQRLVTIIVESHTAARDALGRNDYSSAARLMDTSAKWSAWLMERLYPKSFSLARMDLEEAMAGGLLVVPGQASPEEWLEQSKKFHEQATQD